MEERAFVVIVTGPPGAGKTTLGRKLAQALRLPYLSKDDIKEALFDILGCRDEEWSRKLGHASMEVLFRVLEAQLAANVSLVAETAFIPEYHNERFAALLRRYDSTVIQVYCTCEPRLLVDRIRGRTESGERHPGHVDTLRDLGRIEVALLEGRYGPLDVGGAFVAVDTSDFNVIDIGELLTTIRSAAGA